MLLQPRPSSTHAAEIAPLRTGVDRIVERLSSTGYHIDREKWDRLAAAGLLPTTVGSTKPERDAMGRARRILDVESKLAPSHTLDALGYYAMAAGVDDVPPASATRHIAASLEALFALGDRLRLEIRTEHRFIGPDGERHVARSMARRLLRSLGPGPSDRPGAIETLVSAAFVAYVRSTVSNPRPAHRLHQSSTLVNLDAESAEEEAPSPRTSRGADGPPLSPIADRAGTIAWIGELAASDALGPAVRGSAALVRLHAPAFPEISGTWRDFASQCGPSAGPAIAALALVPPVLAAAYLQKGRPPVAPRLDAALTELMHFWGTVRSDTVRFDLSTRAFPWVGRARRR